MIYIKDMQSGQVREYGTNGHDSLHLSLDGRTLTYENLQNGDGSLLGDYRICDNEQGIIPEDMESPESVYTYVDIGGNSLNSASCASYSRGYADGRADEYHAIMDILNRCGVTVCMEDKQLLTIAEYVEKRYEEMIAYQINALQCFAECCEKREADAFKKLEKIKEITARALRADDSINQYKANCINEIAEILGIESKFEDQDSVPDNQKQITIDDLI